MFVRRTIFTFGILVATFAALPCALSADPEHAHTLQPSAAARSGAGRHGQASCGSDKSARAQARREAALARREAAKAKREEAASKRGEAAQARREAAQARREAVKAKREEAHAAAVARREEAREAAKSKREEAHAAALAKREERKAKYEEAKQRREEAAEERRERMASAAEPKHGRDSSDDDLDTDAPPTSTGGFGTLRVNSRPWAQVYVDGQLVGHTPQLGLNVPAGEHNVRLVNQVFAMSKTFRLNVHQGERVTRVELLDE